jgi:hypothetical protein
MYSTIQYKPLTSQLRSTPLPVPTHSKHNMIFTKRSGAFRGTVTVAGYDQTPGPSVFTLVLRT